MIEDRGEIAVHRASGRMRVSLWPLAMLATGIGLSPVVVRRPRFVFFVRGMTFERRTFLRVNGQRGPPG